jgi:hypothetical protein
MDEIKEDIKITNGFKVTIEAHYFELPFIIEKRCPRCGGTMNAGHGNYLENQPVHLNGDNEIWLSCSDNIKCRYREPVTVHVKCEGILK